MTEPSSAGEIENPPSDLSYTLLVGVRTRTEQAPEKSGACFWFRSFLGYRP